MIGFTFKTEYLSLNFLVFDTKIEIKKSYGESLASICMYVSLSQPMPQPIFSPLFLNFLIFFSSDNPNALVFARLTSAV